MFAKTRWLSSHTAVVPLAKGLSTVGADRGDEAKAMLANDSLHVGSQLSRHPIHSELG